MGGILKAEPLTQLLHQAISPVCSSALLFTAAGNLLAADHAPAKQDARTHAALVASMWQTYNSAPIDGCLADSPKAADTATVTTTHSEELKYLMLELEDGNVYCTPVAKRVLLCLIGPRHCALPAAPPPGSRSGSAGKGSSASSSLEGGSKDASPVGSVGAASKAAGAATPVIVQNNTINALGTLKVQACAMAQYLEKELEGYELPDGL